MTKAALMANDPTKEGGVSLRFSTVRNALKPWLHTRSGAVSPDVDPASPLR